MRITVMGTGYVGLVTGVCLADTGNDVIGYDIDAAKIARLQKGECPIFEPGLSDLLTSNMQAKRLRFSTDLADSVRHGQVIFIAIGTPPRADGSPDLSNIRAAVRDMAVHIDSQKIVVMKSTVPVGTCKWIADEFNALGKGSLVHVVSNPEFLKEGSAVDDFQRPDRVVIGANDPEAAAVIRELHEPFVRNQRPIMIVQRRAAEMIKYAANACLATRISFINEVACLCEAVGVEIDEVIRGIGADARIGYQFLYPGVGYGGSCFPKDVQAFAHVADSNGMKAELINAVHAVNLRQQRRMVDFVVSRFGKDLSGRTFALWGCSFKPRTDDIREAPALRTIDGILEQGGSVRAHDPKALPHIARLYGDKVTCCPDAFDALVNADALIVCTEWNDYRSPDFDRMKQLLKTPIIFDGRNVYNTAQMKRLRFEYYSIGRPPVTSRDWHG